MHDFRHFAFMPPRKRPSAQREPVQVDLAADDAALLSRLGDPGEAGIHSPMIAFMESLDARGFRAGDAENHDRVLTDMYLEPLREKR